MGRTIHNITSLLFLIHGLLLSIPLPGQENFQTLLKPAHNNRSVLHEPYREIVYIHTDRSFYITGEYVKFKVYCLERSTGRPSRLSRVAYVEIYDRERSEVFRSRIALSRGTGSGEIYIPTNANTGNFIIRGYTRWMRNNGPGYFFHAILPVVNPFKNQGSDQVPDDPCQTPGLFIEGGMLIHNLPAKVIFHGYQTAGLSGKLVADDSILVSEFKVTADGLGNFEFTPEADVEYHVEITRDDGKVCRLPLPAVRITGISLRLIDTGKAYRVEFFSNDPSIITSSEKLRFLTSQKGRVISEEIREKTNGLIRLEAAKDLFDEGTFTIAVFNQAGEKIISRKGFKFSGSLAEPDISLNKAAYGNREQVHLNMPTWILDYNVSVSVSACMDPFRGKYISLEHQLLLDNGLNYFDGVEKYFDGSAEDINGSINNLLVAYPNKLSDGSDIGPETEIAYLPEIRAPLATGRIYNKTGGEPGKGVMVFLSVPGKWNRFYASKTGNDGRFLFELKGFFGKHEIIVQCPIEDSLYTIELDDPFSDEYLDTTIPELHLTEKMRGWLEGQSQNMQVENAYRKFRPDMPLITTPDSSAFYGEPDNRYYLDDYTRFPVMEEVMREYIANVYVRRNNDGFHFRVNDLEFDIVYEDSPLMLLDGVPVFDSDEIIALDPLRIEKIETITHAYSKGFLECHGLVSFTSYNGDLAGYTPPPDAVTIDYESIDIQKIYSFPDYSNEPERTSRVPDFRNSLFWLPALDREKNPTVIFFTSDDVNHYEIRINGINSIGKPFSATAAFFVDQ